MKVSYLFALLFLFACKSGNVASVDRPSQWAKPAHLGDLGNFYKLSDSVYRSQQPDRKEMLQLKEFGIKTIVNFRNLNNDDHEARGTNLQLVHVPINTWKMSYDDLVKSVKAIADSEKPVLVHCIHGSDRTGAAIAGYRMVVEGWEKSAAISEFRNGGYGFHERWFPNVLRLLEEVNVDSLRRDIRRLQD